MTKKETILQAIADFDTIEKAIEECGVDIPYDTDTKDYGGAIKRVYEKGVMSGVDLLPIASVDETQFSIDENKTLHLLDIAMDKVTGLSETYQTKAEAKVSTNKVRYEISHKPTTTLVDYREKEIRVMFPADTKWVKQNVGANGDATKYYFGFKAYAPDDSIVSFKEDLAETIFDETMYYFVGNDFAGVDEYGRKYSIVWLPAAAYNETTGVWTYYGAASTEKKYIGWYYSVEWYNAAGKKVASDTIRINLSNEDCHGNIEPYYMSVEVATDEEVSALFS